MYHRNYELPNQLMQALERDGVRDVTFFKYSLLPSISTKVDFLTELLKSHKIMPKLVQDEKDNEKSEKFRKEANKLYALKKDEEALKMYTKCVAYAANKSESLGLAYGNRSAVLFKLKMFQECIQDIDRAYENNYPESLRIKLQERRQNASDLRSKQKKDRPKLYHQAIPEIPMGKKNPLIECASDSVRITSDPKYGRYIEATKDIEIGEVIAVEKAVYTLLSEEQWCHCYHCLTLCYNPLPCERCTIALYCSSTCKENAQIYHRFECPILATIQGPDFTTSRALPLRILFLLGNDLKHLDRLVDDSDEVYRSGRYKEIHNLKTNEEHKKIVDLFEIIVAVAIFWNLVDNHTDFTKNENHELHTIFKEMLFHLFQIQCCNCISLSELRNSDGRFKPSTLGAGFYSFLSLFNHSCSPNVINVDFGTTRIVVASENIKKGEQLFSSYGYCCDSEEREERRAKLKKQFYFDCACDACINNWPTLYSSPNKFNSVDTFRYLQMVENPDLKTARDLKSVLKRKLKKLKPPCKDYFLVKETWELCWSVLGNIRWPLNEFVST